MQHQLYRLNAFTDNNTGGNPAGVVLNADELDDVTMMAIAQDLAYSETAFVMSSTCADFRVRFFTPVEEVDLCGHATIATFNLLRDLGHLSTGPYTQETKAGILQVHVYDEHVFMSQALPTFHDLLDQEAVKDCFNSKTNPYIGQLPIQIVSTGLRDIFLPIKDLETLLTLEPNLTHINRISQKYNVVGIHAFVLDSLHQGDAHVRNFAPRYGINEESATGTSNGGLSCYLIHYMNHQFDGSFVIEQGYCMGQPSKIMTKVDYDDDKITQVLVGGSAQIINDFD